MVGVRVLGVSDRRQLAVTGQSRHARESHWRGEASRVESRDAEQDKNRAKITLSTAVAGNGSRETGGQPMGRPKDRPAPSFFVPAVRVCLRCFILLQASTLTLNPLETTNFHTTRLSSATARESIVDGASDGCSDAHWAIGALNPSPDQPRQ